MMSDFCQSLKKNTFPSRESVVQAVMTLLDEHEASLKAIGGCGDGGCVIDVRKGQHTNGGCRCSEERNKARSAMQRSRYFRYSLRALLEEASK